MLILLSYLVSKGVIDDPVLSRGAIIDNLEILRNIEPKNIANPKERSIIGFLLSLVPNKYHLQACMFEQADNYHIIMALVQPGGIAKIKEIYNYYVSRNIINADFYGKVQIFIETIPANLGLLTEIGIDCNSAIIQNTVGEWCQAPYLNAYKYKTLQTGCNPSDYISGFYKDNPPSLDIGILRHPNDLPLAFDAMEKNKFLLPLNKSNYKLYLENNDESFSITNVMTNNIDESKWPNLINEPILDEILKDSGVEYYSNDKKQALVWKVMNFCGYDIGSPYFTDLVLSNEEEYREFNAKVKELAEKKINDISWADHTFIRLASNLPEEDKKSLNEDPKNINTIKQKYSMKLIKGGYNALQMSNRTSNDNSLLITSTMGGILSLNLQYLLIAIIICLTIFLFILIKKNFYNKKYCNKSHNYYHQYSTPIFN